jgi:CBS domain-containing protein
MPQKIREVMSRHPVTVAATATASDAAARMREWDIGDVLVVDEEGELCGILTDRDIVIRTVALGLVPEATAVGSICSHELVKVHEDDPVDAAVELMQRKAIRRLPVVRDRRPVGVLSLGDVAENRDPESVLGRISRAAPNH